VEDHETYNAHVMPYGQLRISSYKKKNYVASRLLVTL